jgi:hypothetical protein
MDYKNSSTPKRSASRSPIKSSSKKQKKKYNSATVNLNERLSKTMGDFITSNLNAECREKCLKTLDVNNGSEAGKKIEELVGIFKGNKEQKAIKKNSEKINENSP